MICIFARNSGINFFSLAADEAQWRMWRCRAWQPSTPRSYHSCSGRRWSPVSSCECDTRRRRRLRDLPTIPFREIWSRKPPLSTVNCQVCQWTYSANISYSYLYSPSGSILCGIDVLQEKNELEFKLRDASRSSQAVELDRDRLLKECDDLVARVRQLTDEKSM